MRTAYLYIRVSTDEQAIRGYSLRVQEGKLHDFCISNNICPLKTIKEDYSARTFDRPEWKKIITNINRKKDQHPDLILFTKWDRFSRNVADAYYTIRLLKQLDIELQAIEQPLDLSVPENKILLAIYIATSEVENDRRSLNVRQGIHKARQEGRWTAKEPLGYSYKLTIGGKKCIVPKEPEASFVKKAFKLIASDEQLSIQSVYNLLTASGLKCSKSQFWRIIKNPIYKGKVVVPAFEGQKVCQADGVHEAIIPDELFLKVQNRLNSKKRNVVAIKRPIEKLIFRGFVYCPNCNMLLTGSGSKGRRMRYYYYHCHYCSNFRIRADRIDELWQTGLDTLTADKLYIDLYREILKHIRKDLFVEHVINQGTINQITNRLIERIIKAKELSLKGEIEEDDFQVIKADCETRINLIGEDLNKSILLQKENDKNLNKSALQLSQLGNLWKKADFLIKRKLLALILSSRPVLNNELRFCDIVKHEILILYDLEATDHRIKSNIDFNDLGSLSEKCLKDMVDKVLLYERGRDHDVSQNQARGIINFLINLATLTTENI